MSECLLPQTIKILSRIRILLSMRNLQWVKWDTVIYTKKICKSSYKMQRCFCFLLYFHFSFKRSFFYLSTYLFVFQLTSQKLVDQIVRAEKMFFLSSFLLILSFFFQTRKKRQIYLFRTACISSFSFWQNKYNVKWILNFNTKTIYMYFPLFNSLKSWLKHGRLLESYYTFHFFFHFYKKNQIWICLNWWIKCMTNYYFPTIYIVPLITLSLIGLVYR